MKDKNQFFAEIIESSLESWMAQSWKTDTFPDYGSLVVVEEKNRKIFGIVYQIQTGSIEQGRYPMVYQKTEEELLREQPQIFEFLKTTFNCLTVGYQENDKIFYMLCPNPGRIHSFIRSATQKEILNFFKDCQYLHLLFGQAYKISNIDELLLAVLNNISKNKPLLDETFDELIKNFSLLTNNDYRRLKLFLKRAENLINNSNSNGFTNNQNML